MSFQECTKVKVCGPNQLKLGEISDKIKGVINTLYVRVRVKLSQRGFRD